jgi:hypothetical protein
MYNLVDFELLKNPKLTNGHLEIRNLEKKIDLGVTI